MTTSALIRIACVLAVAPAAQAADFPSRPLRWICPLAAGGGTDLTTRMVALQPNEPLPAHLRTLPELLRDLGYASACIGFSGPDQEARYRGFDSYHNYRAWMPWENRPGDKAHQLNLQALPRRLMLDFRDVFSEGFAFDAFRGDVSIQQGMASTNNLQMKGVNAAVLMEGRADLARETIEIKVVVV